MAGLLLVMAAGCTTKSAPAPELIRPVKTLLVSAGSDLRTRIFPGKVDAAKRVELAF